MRRAAWIAQQRGRKAVLYVVEAQKQTSPS